MKKMNINFLYFILLFFNLFSILIYNQSKPYIYKYYFVSAYFTTNGGKKHTNNDYYKWSRYFFHLINSSIDIYIQNDLDNNFFPKYYKGRILKYKSIWNIPCISKYIDEYNNYQFLIDPENSYHSSTYYAIWNSKICLLKMTSEIINSKLYIWIDIGSNRDNIQINNFPSLKIMNELYKLNKMFFFIISNLNPIKKNKPELIVGNWIEGGTFGGRKENINKYYNIFWKVHDYYLKEGLFIGKDQTLYNTMAIYFDNVTLIKNEVNDICQSKWFSFYCMYGDKTNYKIYNYNYNN